MLTIKNFSKRFGDDALFDNLNYRFPQGRRISLVGVNGAGKTTLLQGLIDPSAMDGGEVVRPKDINIAHLPQFPNANPAPTVLKECTTAHGHLNGIADEIEQLLTPQKGSLSPSESEKLGLLQEQYRIQGGYSLEAKAAKILSGLGFSESDMQRHPLEFSGGWRMRLEMAKLFIVEPEFLILDEPTNHLDLPAMIWFESYLKSYQGTLLFVSHDKGLLNRLANVTLHLAGGELKEYPGGFDDFIARYEVEKMESDRRQLKQKKELDRLDQFINRFRAKASKAKQVQSKLKYREKIAAGESAQVDDSYLSESSSFGYIPNENLRLPNPCLEVSKLTFGYGSALTPEIDFVLGPSDKLAIIGANGVGKSSLVKTIVGQLSPLSGECHFQSKISYGYFSQNLEEIITFEDSVLDNARRLCPDQNDKQLRKDLGRFQFSGDAIGKRVEVLSGGEKVRLSLGLLLSKNPNFLILDEPTHHLDLVTAENLIQFLIQIPIPTVIVSHDRDLLARVPNKILYLGRNRDNIFFDGGYSDFYDKMGNTLFSGSSELVGSDSGKSEQCKKGDSDAESNAAGAGKSAMKVDYREERRIKQKIEKIEEGIKQQEKIIEMVNKEMYEHTSGDMQVLGELQSKLHAAEQGKQELEQQWVDLATKLEAIQST